MLKNAKITMIDNATIQRRVYDEDRDATRVVIVAGEPLKFNIPKINIPDYSNFLKWIKVCMVAQTMILTTITLLLIIRR